MMSTPSWPLFAVTNSMALITSLVLPAPLRSRTLSAMSRAFGATPGSAFRRQIPTARDQPRHVGAVAVIVCGRRSDPASSEIVEAGDPVTELGPSSRPESITATPTR